MPDQTGGREEQFPKALLSGAPREEQKRRINQTVNKDKFVSRLLDAMGGGA